MKKIHRDGKKNFISKQRSNSFDDISSIEERIAEPKKNLRTHLMEQILLEIPEGNERKVAILILDLIEPSGWINFDIDEFTSKNNLEKDMYFKSFRKITKIRTNWSFFKKSRRMFEITVKRKRFI